MLTVLGWCAMRTAASAAAGGAVAGGVEVAALATGGRGGAGWASRDGAAQARLRRPATVTGTTVLAFIFPRRRYCGRYSFVTSASQGGRLLSEPVSSISL